MRLYKQFIILSLFISFSPFLYSQYIFDHLNQENSTISDNYIEQVYEARNGFIWIATHNGLNRFTGKEFELFKIPDSLGNEYILNTISVIEEDSDGKLLLGTNGGIVIFDPNANTFEHISCRNTKLKLTDDGVQDIVITDSGDIWIATHKGLDHLMGDTLINCNNLAQFDAIKGKSIYDLCFDSQKNLWIGTVDGLYCYKHAGSSFEEIRNGINRNLPFRYIFEDSEHTIWAASPNNGIYTLKKGEDTFSQYLLIDENDEPLSQASYSSLCEDEKGNIWIGSYIDGLIITDKHTHRSIKITNESPSPYNISGNSIDRLYRDSFNTIWISTHGGGVCFYSPFKHKVEFYTKNKKQLNGKIVSCFLDENADEVWIGTDGAGISLFNHHKKTFTNFSKKNGLISNAVLDIERIDKKTIAIASWNGGLSLFDTEKKQFSNYTFTPIGTENNINNIEYLEKEKIILCATQDLGIKAFDLESMSFSDYAFTKPYKDKLQHANLIEVIVKDNGKLWICENYNLYIGDSDSLFSVTSETWKHQPLQNHFIKDIFYARDRNLYISGTDGLYRFEASSRTYTNILAQKHAIENVRSVTEDSGGNLWICTADMLLKKPSRSDSVINITNKWGIPEMQFYKQSAYRSQNGRLFFGGVNGFIVFNEDENLDLDIKPQTVLTNLYVHNEKQIAGAEGSVLPHNLNDINELVLNYDEAFISIEYSSLNYIDNAKSRFRYKLRNFDKNWHETADINIANYTNIPAGEYDFTVQSTNSNGQWSDIKTLRIIILPPWWKTKWFVFLCALFLTICIIAYVKIREMNILRLNRQLQKEVDKRTNELAVQNQTIKENYQKLKDNQLAIQLKNNELLETVSIKDKLLTVIGHDFRNPLNNLTGIINLLHTKVQSKLNEHENTMFNTLTSTSQTLLNQMIQVLEWSTSHNELPTFKPENINFEAVLDDALLLVQNNAIAKNIRIRLQLAYSSYCYADPRMISIILRNLVSNSIKFTGIDGIITISACETADEIRISIKDSGKGIPKEKLNSIFEQNQSVQTDLSGFGLQICKTLVEQNAGSIFIESEEGNGTETLLYFPKGNRNLSLPVNKIYDFFEVSSENTDDFEFTPDASSLLIIDDSIELTKYLKSAFKGVFNVATAYDGESGEQKAFNIIPDLILCDVNLPTMSGIDLCKKIKGNSLTSHIPIILISGSHLSHQQISGLASGAEDYIFKPFDIAVLKMKINKILASSNSENISNNRKNINTFSMPESIEDLFIKKTTQLIIDRLNDSSFSVELLAEEIGMSRSQLYRKFKAVLGISPIEYIKDMRLQKAMQLLLTDKYRISEIAYEVGFSDYKYFTNCFTKKFGLSPSKYLNQYKTTNKKKT